MGTGTQKRCVHCCMGTGTQKRCVQCHTGTGTNTFYDIYIV